MKDHYIKLFEFNFWANLYIFNFLNSLPVPSDASLHLLKHVIAAEEIWLSRCEYRESSIPLWDNSKNIELDVRMMTELHQKRLHFLQTLNRQDFSAKINYQNSTGVSFSNALTDILTHVVNHGTYHRGQIIEILKKDKLPLPNTDYISWIRKQA